MSSNAAPGQLPHYLIRSKTKGISGVSKLEGNPAIPAELSSIKDAVNENIDYNESPDKYLIGSRIGLGVYPPTATVDAVESKQSEIIKLTSGGGWDFGYIGLYSGVNVRTRIGFSGGAGGIFSNGIANGSFIRADNGPIMFGVGSSLSMIIREAGYAPGTGYVGFGGINNPLSTVEIGGENAPRLGLNPQPLSLGRKHWEIVSLSNDYGLENGDLQFYNRTDGIGAYNIDPSGNLKGSPVGTGDVPALTWSLNGRNAGPNATGVNKRGGLILISGGSSTDNTAFPLQVGVGSVASGGEVGSDNALTISGDRAAATLKSNYRGAGALSEGRFALNLVANGANTGDVLQQLTKYDGVWAGYSGWLYENKVVSVSNASRCPNGHQIAQAAQATPDVLVNLLTLAIAAGSDVRATFGEIILQTGSGSPEGVVVAPPGSFYFNKLGGANQTFYVKESGIGNVGWVGK